MNFSSERSTPSAPPHRLPPAVALLVIAGVTLLALSVPACTSSPSGTSNPSGTANKVTITLYNGQHVQTTQALVSAFEKSTGINVAVRNADENVLDAEIVAEGRRSPADVILSENSPALEYLQGEDLLAPVDRSTLARSPAEDNSPEGDWVAVSARVSVLIYNPSLIAERALPTRVLQIADPRYRGELALAPGETDFQPIVTSVLRSLRQDGDVAVAGRAQDERGQPHLPRQRGDLRRGEPGHRRLRHRQPVLLVPDEGGDRCLRHPLADRPLRRARSWLCPRLLGRRHLEIFETPRGGAEAACLPRLQTGPGDHRPLDELRVPTRSGVPAPQGETPFGELEPNPIGVGELGTGARAVALLREVQLL